MMEDTDLAPRRSVLFVDDDAHLRATFSIRLQANGFNVTAVGTAEEALNIANDRDVPIDVVVMDLFLPDCWGPQVAMEQGLFRPETKVIFISGYAEDDPILQACTSTEGIHFLPKPFTVQELVDLIWTVLAEETPGEVGQR